MIVKPNDYDVAGLKAAATANHDTMTRSNPRFTMQTHHRNHGSNRSPHVPTKLVNLHTVVFRQMAMDVRYETRNDNPDRQMIWCKRAEYI
jgi:hypothetical protein